MSLVRAQPEEPHCRYANGLIRHDLVMAGDRPEELRGNAPHGSFLIHLDPIKEQGQVLAPQSVNSLLIRCKKVPCEH